MDEKEYEFSKTLKRIKKLRGTGTQLVSLYITPGYPIGEASAKIRSEISQAQNIKSKQTRTNVIGALERVLNALKNFRETPPNGLVIFAGNVSPDPSKQDIITITLEPVQKLTQSIYRCDSVFYTEPLERMLEQKDAYGIVVMDGREATLALLRGVNFEILENIESHAHAKVRKGGQSARRYERLIEEQTEYYYKKVGEAMDKHFLGKVKGVIIGGPGPTKDYFVKGKYFNYQHNILGVVDTGYTDVMGVREVIAKAGELIQEQEAVKEKKLLDRFIKEIVHGSKAVYGLDSVLEALEQGRVAQVLVSEGLELKHFKVKCGEEEKEGFGYKPEDVCEKPTEVLEETDIQDYFIDLGHKYGFETHIISTKTVEGTQFLNTFAGLGAFLRY
ncbi:MAG: peptide chain release factor 1 [Candidatus Micrarchaeota archaeon]|nr:peptide chain release factor 1 [Candidatus Micrarchaeota archaeon]